MFYKDIRRLSRKLNKKRYLKSFAVLGFAVLVTALFSALPFIFKLFFDVNLVLTCVFMVLSTLMALFFYSSFFVGEKAWYSGRLTKRKLSFKRLLYWFKIKSSFKAFRLGFILFVLKLLWFSLFNLPSFMCFFAVVTLAFTGGVEVELFFSLLAGGAVLLIVGVMFYFIISQRYFLAPYLLVENPRLGVWQVIKQSKNLIEGQIFYLVRFKLSFLPSFLLYPLIFPVIFLHPHYKQSCCVIAKELRL